MPTLRRSHQLVTFVLCLAAVRIAAAQSTSDVTMSDRADGGLRVSVFAASYQAMSAQATVVVGTEVQGPFQRLELRYLVSNGSAALSEQIVSAPLGDETARNLARREGCARADAADARAWTLSSAGQRA